MHYNNEGTLVKIYRRPAKSWLRYMDKNVEFDNIALSVRDRIFRLAKSMLGCRAEAEDAMQDVLEKLWRQRSSFGEYKNIEALAYTATRNCCIDRIRNRNMKRGKNDAIACEIEYSSDLSRIIDARDINGAIRQIIASLPEKQQTAIHLRDVEDMEYDEIAALTGMDESNIRVALSRARKTVREELTKIMDYGIR